MSTASSIAATLSADRRQHVALQVLSGTEPVAHIAARQQVSRPFLYRQKRKAEAALTRTFAPVAAEGTVIHGRPRFAKHSLLDDMKVKIAAIHPAFHAAVRRGP